MTRTLIDLLQKDVFKRNPEAGLAFEAHKKAMSIKLVLKLQDYLQELVIETGASHQGVGAPLMQNGIPIAYFSKVSEEKHQGKSIYLKEYIDLSVLDKWRHYVQQKHFVVWSDHHSLKYLLEQKVISAIEQKCLTKMLLLDYEVQYRVVDFLSRQQKELDSLDDQATGTIMVIISFTLTWEQNIIGRYVEDAHVQTFLHYLQQVLVDPIYGTSRMVY